MRSPFPGMNPYLEEEGLWHQVHTNLITTIQWDLAPKIKPNYYVQIEQLNYLTLGSTNGRDDLNRIGRPDVLVISPPHKPIKPSGDIAVATATKVKPHIATLPAFEDVPHRYLKIRRISNHEVITVIEILSHANKTGHGRRQYMNKRHNVLSSMTNLVEIDLLRAGKPLPMEIDAENDYRIVVSRPDDRPQIDVYLFGVRQDIPDIPIPLRPEDNEPTLSLNKILQKIYQLGDYHYFINYDAQPTPHLSDADTEWVKNILTTSI